LLFVRANPALRAPGFFALSLIRINGSALRHLSVSATIPCARRMPVAQTKQGDADLKL
jgi:hypothetical protein